LGVKVKNKERVVHITMDRPPLNVLDIPLLRELDAVLTACAEDTVTDVMSLKVRANERSLPESISAITRVRRFPRCSTSCTE